MVLIKIYNYIIAMSRYMDLIKYQLDVICGIIIPQLK